MQVAYQAYLGGMEYELHALDNLDDEERIQRFAEFLVGVVYLDDLFPPDNGVRELATSRPKIGPRVGRIALAPQREDFLEFRVAA